MSQDTSPPGVAAARLQADTLFGLSVLISSLWIAISAAAPEFIWQGLQIALTGLRHEDVLSALLIGAVLAFFIEPIMQRLRGLEEEWNRPGPSGARPRGAIFTAGLSLVFALASVCLHDAMKAYLSEEGHHGVAGPGLAAGLQIAASWSLVPLAISLAWLAGRTRWARLPLGAVAVGSPWAAGLLFSWPPLSMVTTAIPCLFILGFGYRPMTRAPERGGFSACARTVLVVAMAWLGTSLLIDGVLGWLGKDARLYGPGEFWADARFYGGWAIGLLLAPFPLQPGSSSQGAFRRAP